MWGGFEARKFPRVKAECSIYLKPIGTETSTPISATTENIGIGGICAILGDALQKFSQIKIDLDLTDGRGRVRCDGRVVWSVPSRDFASEKLTHDTGIEFISLPEDARLRIERVIGAQP